MKLPITIKKRQSGYVLYTIVGILMLTISLLFLFFPFIPQVTSALSAEMLRTYMILGGGCTLFFAFATASFLFGAVSPPVALKITDDGVYDYTVAGVGAGFIPSDAIVSLKVFGDRRNTFLGIKLDGRYPDFLPSNKKVKKELLDNYAAGLPNIIIKQSDIRMEISELMNILLNAYTNEKSDEQTDTEKIDEESELFTQALLIDDEDELPPEEELLPHTEESYTPILISREKAERPMTKTIKTVDELLAELDIAPLSTGKKDTENESKSN